MDILNSACMSFLSLVRYTVNSHSVTLYLTSVESAGVRGEFRRHSSTGARKAWLQQRIMWCCVEPSLGGGVRDARIADVVVWVEGDWSEGRWMWRV